MSVSQWKEKDVTSANIDEVLHFCLKYEERCVNLVQSLQEERKKLKDKFSFFCLTERKMPLAKAFYLNAKLFAVACINQHQFLLYCVKDQATQADRGISFDWQECIDELCHIMIRSFPFSKVYAVMGEEKVQRRLKDVLFQETRIKATHVVQYILMLFDNECFEGRCLDDLLALAQLHIVDCGKIITRAATVEDLQLILPLQIGYEKEEVCVKGKSFPPYVSMMSLQKIVKDEIIYITMLDEKPIAKANTNAKGIDIYQLGGIYTLPEYRRRGLGRLTVLYLMQHIFKERKKKKVALFVNIRNLAAIAMYNSLKFKDVGRLMISYFR